MYILICICILCIHVLHVQLPSWKNEHISPFPPALVNMIFHFPSWDFLEFPRKYHTFSIEFMVGMLWNGTSAVESVGQKAGSIWAVISENPGYLLFIGDEILPSYKGSIIIQYNRSLLTNEYNGMSLGFWSLLIYLFEAPLCSNSTCKKGTAFGRRKVWVCWVCLGREELKLWES